MNRGKYIVIEGAEGVGKTTQINELVRRFQAANLPVRRLREPDSQSDLTARAIRQLTQDPRYPMNTRTEVLLYNAARSQSLQVIKESLDQGVNCVVDRNYLTTLAIQYYGRGDVPDYQLINTIINFAVGEMEPDLCVILDAPVNILKERLKGRYNGERFDNLDDAFLERVRAGYLWEARQRNLPVIYATDNQESIADQIWRLVTGQLSLRTNVPSLSEPPISVKEVLEQKEASPTDKPVSSDVLVEKNEDGIFIATEAGKEYLSETVSDIDGDVYSFTSKLDPVTIAAAMARLSRRGDDMRITILDEFAGKVDEDAALLKRVITAYGDDSVQQLGGVHLVVENASNLLTKKLEWGRLAAYLEQSTRYIYFDQKDKNGKYKYFVPAELKGKLRDKYISTMDQIFDLYSEMVHELTDYVRKNSSVPQKEQTGAWKAATRAQACDAIRAVLPVATKSTVGIFASGQAVESLIMHLLSDELKEANKVGQKLLKEARKVIPMYLERADKPDRGGAYIAYRANTYKAVQEIANNLLPKNHSDATHEDVTLVDYWPKNEMTLLADMLYEHSDLPLEELQTVVNGWSYDDKVRAFNAYLGERLNRRHRPGRAIEKAHYSWDILCDYGIFRDLQRHRMVDDLNWQQLTPRFGYDIPKLVEEAALTDKYEKCYDLSLELYSALTKDGFSLEAQYACLFGHRMRWKVTYNAREAFHFHELRTSPQGHPGYRKLVLKMHEKLKEVHPTLGEAMKFVNKDEDPELTRLAAEKYTEFKLKQLKS
ncbi:MAG TPA: dTMP kinase [Candidatus Saccharimonadales bacterium]|nr:dTMP kinase [Candidatus Saccharimonadales bacterium]